MMDGASIGIGAAGAATLLLIVFGFLKWWMVQSKRNSNTPTVQVTQQTTQDQGSADKSGAHHLVTEQACRATHEDVNRRLGGLEEMVREVHEVSIRMDERWALGAKLRGSR